MNNYITIFFWGGEGGNLKIDFSHSVYLGLSFQLARSELVTSVRQNLITSEYQNFCYVKILDCCVGIQYFLADNFFLSFFLCEQYFYDF